MHDNAERGAVSIFLVVFFALLIGVITMSFVGIVIRDANQSTNDDLSRSAYDSAQAGVEDAKRAIALTAAQCGGTSSCAYAGYLKNQNCTALTNFAGVLGLRTGVGHEINIQNDANSTLSQAYTCVNVVMNTPDYVGTEQMNKSDVIPLSAVDASGNPTSTNNVTLKWYTHADAGTPNDSTPFNTRNTGTDVLPALNQWNSNGAYTPPLMRVELITYSGTINDNGPTSALSTASRTVFLYPTAGGSPTVDINAIDPKPVDAGHAAPISTANCGGNSQYACTVKLSLGLAAGTTSFLRVTPIYKATTFNLTMDDGSYFNGVQPLVDSTGRANDLFRRVEARVRLQNNVLYPEYAIASSGTICKDFAVGSNTTDFSNNITCN